MHQIIDMLILLKFSLEMIFNGTGHKQL